MKQLLLSALASGSPVLLWGPPGVGKTALAYQIASEAQRHLEVVIASVREPSDFAGLPIIRDDGVTLWAPSWARSLVAAGGGLLVLDELSTAAPAVQAALLRVVHDRVVGDLPLPADTWILGCANPTSCAAGGWDLSAPTANRFLHLQWDLDPMQWSEDFPGYWGAPPVVPGLSESAFALARAEVAAFIHARPTLLLADMASLSEAQAGGAWPSPRSWDLFARSLAACGGWQSEHAFALACGAVGKGAGSEFFSWRRSADLPDPESVLAGLAQIPGRSDSAYAVCAALVRAVEHQLTPARYERAWVLLGECAERGQAAVAAVAARGLARLLKTAEGRAAGLGSFARSPGAAALFRPFASLLASAGLLNGGDDNA